MNRLSCKIQLRQSNRLGAMESGLIVPLLMGIIFGTVGSCLIWFRVWPVFQHGKASEHWPGTQGKVISAEVIRSHDGVQCRPEILFQYQVNGAEFEQSNIRYDGDWSTNRATYAKKLVRKYPAGKQVEVYYDPEDPAEAVLEPGVNQVSYIPLGLGILYLLLGASLFFKVARPLLFALPGQGADGTGRIRKSSLGNDNRRPDAGIESL